VCCSVRGGKGATGGHGHVDVRSHVKRGDSDPLRLEGVPMIIARLVLGLAGDRARGIEEGERGSYSSTILRNASMAMTSSAARRV
jgi:hypothetical protein